jgi:hypothetical protein
VRRHWSSQRVLDALRAGLARGESPAAIWSDNALSSAAVVYFGSRQKALSAAGLETPVPRRWTKAMVVEALRAQQQQGLPLENLGKRDPRLASAAYRQFGSWHRAMQAAGLKTSQRKWSKERIIRELRAQHRLPQSARPRTDRLLAAAALRYFGGIRHARLASGIEPNQNKWSKQRIIERIQDHYVKGLPVQSARCEDRALRSAAKRYFGNWRKALLAAGIVDASRLP